MNVQQECIPRYPAKALGMDPGGRKGVNAKDGGRNTAEKRHLVLSELR